jgi:hypothetical protein
MGTFSRTFHKVSDAMRLTERFTPVADTLILYEIIYDDAKLFTRPIKSVGYFFPPDDGQEMVEDTCNETSYSLRNIFGF